MSLSSVNVAMKWAVLKPYSCEAEHALQMEWLRVHLTYLPNIRETMAWECSHSVWKLNPIQMLTHYWQLNSERMHIEIKLRRTGSTLKRRQDSLVHGHRQKMCLPYLQTLNEYLLPLLALLSDRYISGGTRLFAEVINDRQQVNSGETRFRLEKVWPKL